MTDSSAYMWRRMNIGKAPKMAADVAKLLEIASDGKLRRITEVAEILGMGAARASEVFSVAKHGRVISWHQDPRIGCLWGTSAALAVELARRKSANAARRKSAAMERCDLTVRSGDAQMIVRRPAAGAPVPITRAARSVFDMGASYV